MSVRINGVNYETTINEQGTGLGTAGRASSTVITGIGTYHMADNPNMYEVQRTNNFEFVVTGVDTLYRPGTTDKIANGQDVIRVSVKQAFVPHFEQQPLPVRRGNSELKYAGVPSFKSGSYTFYDFIGIETYEVLQAWQYLSYNVATEKVGLASDYKKDCYIYEMTPDYQPVRTWRLHGCWISSLSKTNPDNSANNLSEVSCTIEYDRAEIVSDK